MNAAQVHPTAVVDEDVRVGENSKIWHFCHVSRGARLGRECSLGQNVFIGEGVPLGDRVKVQNNVSIYSGAEIGSDVFIGPSVVFTNVKRPRAPINQKSRYAVTSVGHGATLGANSTIVCGVTIGEFAFVAAGSVVTKDVAPFALVQGNPARQVGWVDADGQRAEGPPAAGPLASTNSCDAKSAPATSPSLPRLTDENIPLLPALEAVAKEVLGSGQFIQGPEVARFEEDVARFLGAKHAVSCSNASDALVMALAASGVGPGDEVITTAYSFVATAESIARLGARPVLVDIEEDSFHFDLDLVLGALTERTRAVIAVHLFGQTQDLSSIRSALRDRSISLIEDAAQAFGAKTSSRRMLGSESEFACFSFFPSKNLGGFGDGGLVTTTSDEAAEKLRALRLHGARTPQHHEFIGGNFRLDALQAALLRAKLPHVPDLLLRRKANARRYYEKFESANIARARLHLPGRSGPDHTYNQFVIRSPERDALREHLRAQKIDCPIYYPTPLHQQPSMKSLVFEGARPHAERAAKESLALPVYPALDEHHIDRVAEAVLDFFR